MANKVSIFIINSEGRHFELTNSKMALLLAKDSPRTNWNLVFRKEIPPYSLILSDLSNPYNVSFGMGYSLVEEFENEKLARSVMEKCKEMLRKQYERMMGIRVAKKYGLNPDVLLKIQMEYHDPANYEFDIKNFLNHVEPGS